MPSTRSAARHSTRTPSQSQSQTQSQDLRAGQSVGETFETVSTAVLPPAYTITLASVGDVDAAAREAELVRGQEYLHDAVRRRGDKEGDLRDLVHARKRRKVGGKVELDKDVLWYTASLRWPCSCDLDSLRNAFTLRRPPPTADDLPDLPDTQTSTERVQQVSELPDWSAHEDAYADIEPELDYLREFEHGWQDAKGSMWAESQGSGRFCDAFEDHEAEVPSFEAIKESLMTTRIRKGKYKAVDTPSSAVLHHFVDETAAVIPSPLAATPIAISPVDRNEPEAWEREAKRRKQLWRGLIGKDPGYGLFWAHLSRPHTYCNLGALPDQRRPPDYNLFRNYRTAAHPFHPDLSHFARKNPYGRVYWLIPVHGPVLVPSLNDGALEGTPVGAEVDIPIPSSATLSLDRLVSPPAKLPRPAPVCWTPRLLNHFVDSFLRPLRQTRLYSLAIACSGPKPDPFIALKPAPPIARHRYIPKGAGKVTPTATERVPVRPEAGDHIRLYCDASEALSLRTWLNGVAIDPAAVGDAAGGKAWKLFDRTRLCLVGELGEVLIIA